MKEINFLGIAELRSEQFIVSLSETTGSQLECYDERTIKSCLN
jgi:hypothetical protein